MKTSFLLTIGSLLLAIFNVSAATRYVSLESTNPTPPYTNWATAATNIQQAVDAAVAGDTVLVTDGVYTVGQRDVSVLDTNQQPPQLLSVGLSRVVVTNSIRLESVNGPLVTTIDGSGGVRCVFLGTNAVLTGFTLTAGTAFYGGGAYGGTLCNCMLTSNSAYLGGGGAYACTLYCCTLAVNETYDDYSVGGGAAGCTLYNCTLSNNQAGATFGSGGGAYGCILYDCTLTGNYAHAGGIFMGFGGGAEGCTLYNCVLTGNQADGDGGGASECTLNNCTLTRNSARYGGGAYGGSLNNCTVYFNTATNGANYFTGTDQWGRQRTTLLNYSCTTPMPTNGLGNITNDPLFVNAYAGDFRLRPDSPCIDAGTNLTGGISNDILGLPRPMDGNGDGIARFDIGAYEFNPYRFEPTLRLSTNSFQFTVCGEPGRSVRIERSRDLVNWEFAGQVPIPIGGQTLIDPAATTESRLFYRAIRVP